MPATILARIRRNYLHSGVASLQLCAHLLQLQRLLVYHCSQIPNFTSELCNRRFLFLNLAILLLASAMLFEELVEQHRVHRLVAHRVDPPSVSRATRAGFTFATSSATSPNCGMPSGSRSFL